MDSDEKIIKEYLEGNRSDIGELIEKHIRHIYNFIRQYIGDEKRAEDLTQEVFLKVWKNLKKFDVNKNFVAWLFRIARNTVIDFFRKKKNVNFSDLENEGNGEEPDFTGTDPSPEERYEEKELQILIRGILEELPEKYRSVLILYHQSQFNFREIAEISGEPIDTIKSRYRRALGLVRKKLEERAMHQKASRARKHELYG
jgi:RNA polymerase sigma-70 factor (ECF subfamily)